MVQNTSRASPGSLSGGRSTMAEYSQRSRGSMGDVVVMGSTLHSVAAHDRTRPGRDLPEASRLGPVRHIRGLAAHWDRLGSPPTPTRTSRRNQGERGDGSKERAVRIRGPHIALAGSIGTTARDGDLARERAACRHGRDRTRSAPPDAVAVRARLPAAGLAVAVRNRDDPVGRQIAVLSAGAISRELAGARRMAVVVAQRFRGLEPDFGSAVAAVCTADRKSVV